MSLPDPVLGDTVMHYAVKQRRYTELLEMLCHDGNPFVKNKDGESVASILEKESNDKEMTVEESPKKVFVIEVTNFETNSTFFKGKRINLRTNVILCKKIYIGERKYGSYISKLQRWYIQPKILHSKTQNSTGRGSRAV